MSPSPPSIRWANSPVTVPQVKAYSLTVIRERALSLSEIDRDQLPPPRITTQNRCCKGRQHPPGSATRGVGSARVFCVMVPEVSSRSSSFRGGTASSNPASSSRQSVSHGICPSCIEKPAVAAACAGPARRHGRQRRARLVNITPTAGNVSVGPYSSTAVPARRFATVVALVRQARSGRPGT
jgi:hypothetical protein